MSPWLSMFGQPKKTIRAVLHTNPRYGVLYLAAIYALECFFYYSNWWSLGLSFPLYPLILTCLVLSPIAGFIWLYFSSWIFYFTGRLLKGKAPALHLRTALAWSHIPAIFSILMWFALLATHPDTTFIQDAGIPSSLFINSITLIATIWSFVLLVQSIREIQGFSLACSVGNIVLSWFISSILSFVGFVIFRHFYISL